jgi:hypothetical protein
MDSAIMKKQHRSCFIDDLSVSWGGGGGGGGNVGSDKVANHHEFSKNLRI